MTDRETSTVSAEQEPMREDEIERLERESGERQGELPEEEIVRLEDDSPDG